MTSSLTHPMVLQHKERRIVTLIAAMTRRSSYFKALVVSFCVHVIVNLANRSFDLAPCAALQTELWT